MKKGISALLSALMIMGSVPSVMAEEVMLISAAPKEDKPAVIYIAEGFENQETGKHGNGLWWYHQTDTDGIKTYFHEVHEVEKLEKGGNAENQAVILKAEKAAGEINFIPVYYAPIWTDFVFDFNFKLGSEKANGVIGSKNNLKDLKRGLYCDGYDGSSDIIKLGSTITVGETEVKSGVDTAWHRLTLKVNMNNHTADVYFDGELIKEAVKIPEVSNYCEFTFASPDVLGEYWALDDVNIYLSDKILPDGEFETQLKEYRESGVAPIDRYQTGFLYQYRNYVYETMYNEFVLCKYGRRIYKDNKFYSLPHNVFEENGKLFVPLRVFCEAMGATVGYYDGIITVDLGSKSMKISKDSKTYYINEETFELPQLVEIRDWHTIVSLDVLTDFFGLELSDIGHDVISFTGDVASAYDFPPEIPTSNRWYHNTGKIRLSEEAIWRMKEMLSYDLPTTEQVIERFTEKNPDPNKISILGTWYDFDDVRAMWANGNPIDPVFKTMMTGVLGVADTYLRAPDKLVPEGKSFEIHAGGVQNRETYLAFAYKVTGDEKYLDGIKRDIDVVYDSIESWNEKPQTQINHKALTIAVVGTGVGTAYDWIKNDLDAERRSKLKTICDTVMEWYDGRYADPVRTDASAFTYSGGNQVIIITNGVLTPAMATFHENPKYSAELMAAGIDSTKVAFNDFAPAGEYRSGVSYWQYCVSTMSHLLMNVESALGDTCGLYEAPGVSETCGYPLSIQGTTGDAYPFGDGDKANPYNSYFMYEGHKNGDMGTVNMRKNNQGQISIIDIMAWVPDDGSGVLTERPTDQHLKDSGTAIMRSGWSKADTSVILHAGSTGDGHGHLDNGDVQFDMLGYRWATAVGRECYNMYQFGDYNLKEGSLYTGYTAFDYYRDKGEGHNTVIANLGATRFDMEKNAKSLYRKVEFSDTESFAIVDMTPTNRIYEDASRGVKFDKVSGEIIIQDEFKAKEATEFWWFMHTQAEIKLSEDKKSAILSTDKGKKQIMLSIVSDGDEVFQDLPAAPIPGYPTATEEWYMRKDSGYPEDAMLRPPKESPLDGTFKGAGYAPGNFGVPFRKLAIQKKDSKTFNVTVVARPITGTAGDVIVNTEVTPLGSWAVDKNEKPAMLNSVTVNGEPLDGFKPNGFNYIVDTMTDKDPVPEIVVSADGKYTVEVNKAVSVPGITSVILRENGKVKGSYFFTFKPLNDTSLFVNERQIPLAGFTCNSEPEVNNPAVHLFDGNMTTSYTTDAAGGGVTLDFGKNVDVAEVMMSFRNGASRTENFTIEASVDGENFEMLFKGTNSGTSSDWESFTFGKDVNARYIRVLFYGNNSGSSWCNITGMAALTK